MAERYGAIKIKIILIIIVGGGRIERVLIIESGARGVPIIDEILEKLKNHPDIELLWLKYEPVLSLPGLEIDPAHRKVYCDNQAISLTAKEYDILCLFTANKGRVLTMTRYIKKYGRRRLLGMQTIP